MRGLDNMKEFEKLYRKKPLSDFNGSRAIARHYWKAALEWVLNDNEVFFDNYDEYGHKKDSRCFYVDDIK